MLWHRNELDVTSLARPKGQISFILDAGCHLESSFYIFKTLEVSLSCRVQNKNTGVTV